MQPGAMFNFELAGREEFSKREKVPPAKPKNVVENGVISQVSIFSNKFSKK